MASDYGKFTPISVRSETTMTNDTKAPERIEVAYTNWKGVTSTRHIVPQSIRFAATEWHPEPQWLLRAWDEDRQAWRDFALKDFDFQRDTALAAQGALIEQIAAKLERLRNIAVGYNFKAEAVTYAVALDKVRSASPDATAALEAVRREAVEQERERCAALLEEKANAFPVGHENHEKGASSYNWFKTCAAAIRDTPPQET